MTKFTPEEVWASRPLLEELEHRGVRVIGEGTERKACCPIHEDSNPSFALNVERQAWKCHAGCGGGSVVDLIAKLENRSSSDVYKEMISAMEERQSDSDPFALPTSKPAASTPTNPPPTKAKPVEVKSYSYRDQNEIEAYQVVRYEPKTFRQRYQKDGQWVWNMDGITRFLYRLPEITRAQEVWVCEGEKDADILSALGFQATCNVGGAGKWLDSYTETLHEKDVILCGDNDKPGVEHMDMVAKSLEGKVASLRRVTVPKPHKDIFDHLNSYGSNQGAAKAAAEALKNSFPHHKRGIDLPLQTMAELEEKYVSFIRENSKHPIDLGRWLPSFRHHLRPLVPGDLVFILAATAAGKTAALQNISSAFKDIPTVLFELELSDEAMFERVLGERSGLTGHEVERSYRERESFGKEAMENVFQNLLICTKSKLTVSQIDTYCQKAELKLGAPPRLILIDYIQLLDDDDKGKSRYEKYSNIAEAMRSLAKSRRATVIVTSQVQRKGADDDQEVHLSDGKESGSIENSSSLVLGLWREYEENQKGFTKTCIRILKNTRGKSGALLECNWNPNLRITERSSIPDDALDEKKPRHKN